jgi:site-specific DNA recombinase
VPALTPQFMKYFVYCRKSSEDEERQALSIFSQRTELERKFPPSGDIEIVAVLEEEKSAKSPGRPVFGSMMQRIEAGEAEGIIAWAPDRLARNSIDGGGIIYQLDLAVLKNLKFATYTFENNPQGKFMLQIMFGQSKYYSDALSENVRRGNRTKVELGWRPNLAPLGYLNEPITITIIADPERFGLIRQMWNLMLSGAYNPDRIRVIANEEWGFRTRTTKRRLGGPLQKSTIYKLFNNPFYAGLIVWEGRQYPGQHTPMVTLAEFERVQLLLGGNAKPQPQKHHFPYTGLIKCGSCGLSVTAERKINRHGYRYTYYHCTRRLRPRCAERSIESDFLEDQIADFLESLRVGKSIEAWLVAELTRLRNEQKNEQDTQTLALQREADKLDDALRELTDIRLRRILSDEEFVARRTQMLSQRDRLLEEVGRRASQPDYWFEPALSVISFNKHGISWLSEGDDEDRRLIIRAVGSNLTLANEILSIEAKKPFLKIPKRRLIPLLWAYVEAIREAAPLPGFQSAINAIKLLEDRAAKREQRSVEHPQRP